MKSTEFDALKNGDFLQGYQGKRERKDLCGAA